METVKRLEKEMGRDICGEPTSSGLPCKEWPVSDDHGRCSKHKPSAENQSGQPSTEPTTESTGEPADPQQNGKSTDSYFGSYKYWIVLGLIGLGLGGSATASYLVTDYSGWWSNEKNVEVTQSDTNERPLTIDVNDPNFSRIYEAYQNGRTSDVLMALDSILEQSGSRTARSKALYHKYVFFQDQQQFRSAVEAADRFVHEYSNHALRPEVLYGGGMMCNQYLDEPCETDFHSILREEYPESKWIEQISGSS